MRNKIIITILALGFLSQASVATAITDWNFFGKEVLADIAARGIQRGVMTGLSNSITNLVLESDKTQSATGRPGFVQNWRDHMGEGRFRGENVFRYQFGQTGTCGYFRDELGALFGADPDGGNALPINTKAAIARLHPYELTSRCTLTYVTGGAKRESDPDSKSGDGLVHDIWFHSNDAWGSFAELSRPQNNFFGAFNMAMNELVAQSEFGKEVTIRDTVDGFKPIKWVPEESDFFNEDSPGCIPDSAGRCIAPGDVGTPAGTQADVTFKVFDMEFDLIANADDIEDLIIVVSAGLVTKLTNFSNADSIEMDAKRSVVNLQDWGNATACMEKCNEKVFGNSTASCMQAMTEILAMKLDQVAAAAASSGDDDGGNGGNGDGDEGRRDSGINITVDTTLLQVQTNPDGSVPGETPQQTLERQAMEVCTGDSPEIRYAKCQMFCMEYLQGAELNPEGEGRCGVNYPKPECFCSSTDPTSSWQYVDMVKDIQRRIAREACSDGDGSEIGIVCDGNMGRLVGGLNTAAGTLYMDALSAAISASGSGVTGNYHWVGDEPILGVDNGERTEYYDVITSAGRVWNNDGKVICTPKSPRVNPV